MSRKLVELAELGSATPCSPPSSAAFAFPTTLLWVRHDRFVPLGLADGASARLGWPPHVIDDAGHAPRIERPDAFVDALRGTPGRDHIALSLPFEAADEVRAVDD